MSAELIKLVLDDAGDGRASTIAKYSDIGMCTRAPSVADA